MQNKILIFTEVLKRFCLSICLFVCPLLFLTDTTQNPFVIQPLFLSIFSGCFVLCCAAEIIFKREINFRYSKLDFVFIAFLFSLFLSLLVNYFFSNNKFALINEFLRKSDYLIFGLIFGFLFAKTVLAKINVEASSYQFFKKILFWCLAWLLWKVQASAIIAVLIFTVGVYLCFNHIKKYGIQEVIDIMLAVCFCASLYGIMQALGFELFWVLDISKEFGSRSVSTFGNPNFLASFVLLFLPYSLLLFLQAKNKLENFISGFITLILVLFLIISGTRSAWLGFIVFGIIFFALSVKFRKIFSNKFLKIFILLLILCASAFALIVGLKHSSSSTPNARISEVKQVFNLKSISLKSKNLIAPLHQRLMMWHCALDNLKKSPFLGKGVNSFQLNYPYCQGKLIAENPALDKLIMQANNAHNEYLEILSDGGLLSFVTYIFLWGLFFKMFNKKIKTFNKEEKYFYFALILGLISVLVDNLLNITLRTLLVSFAFWFVFSSINNLNTTSKKINLNKNICYLIFILTCFITYCLINIQTKYFVAQTYELKGYKNLVKGNYQDTVLNMNKVIKLSSFRPEPYYTLLNAYINLDDLNNAQNIAEKVLKLYPAYYEFHYRLGALNQVQNKQEQALNEFRKTLLLLPTYSPAAEGFAGISSKQKTVPVEDKYLLKSLIRILPYEPNLPSYLAEIYFKENDCSNASAFALDTLQKNIFDKSALKIFTDCNNSGVKNDFLQKAQKINNLKDEMKLKQDDGILKKINELQKEYPNEKEIQVLLSEFYFRQGKFCESMEILKLIKNGMFWSKSNNISLSLSAQKCGDIETSKQALTEVLDFCPYDEFAKNRLKNVKI